MFSNDPDGAEAILQVRAASLCDDERFAKHLHSRAGCVALTHPYSIAKSEPDVRPDITNTGMPVSADSGAKLAMRLGTDADFPAQNAKEYRFWG